MSRALLMAAAASAGLKSPTSPPITYLLDTYPGAVAAYSCGRALRTGLSSILDVVRSSDLSGINVGNSGENLDVATMTAFIGANSGLVSRLTNQATNLNSIHSGSGFRPSIIVSGALQTLGSTGKPSMTFGAGHIFSSVTDLPNFGTSAGLSGNPAYTVFAVYRKTTNTAGCVYGWGNTGASLGAAGYYDDGTAAQQAYAGGQAFNTSVPANSTHFLMTHIKTPGALNTTSAAYRNGVSVATTGHGTGTPSIAGNYPLILGQWAGYAPNKLLGSLQEIIIFNSDQSANRAAIEANIMAFYGI